MSKIAQKKAFEYYPKDRKGCLYDLARKGYIDGYEQCQKDLLEKVKELKILNSDKRDEFCKGYQFALDLISDFVNQN